MYKLNIKNENDKLSKSLFKACCLYNILKIGDYAEPNLIMLQLF